MYIAKPYPNFHAARIRQPGLFLRIRVLRKLDNGIMLYGGPLKTSPGGSTKIQSVRFPKKSFSTSEAKKWLKDHNYTAISFEPAKKSEAGLFDLNEVVVLEKSKEALIDVAVLIEQIWKFVFGSGEESILTREKLYNVYSTIIGELGRREVEVEKTILYEVEEKLEKKQFDRPMSIVVKEDDEERVVCGIVYEPNETDAQGDTATAKEIRKAAHYYMEHSQQCKVNHRGKAIKSRVLESYIAPSDFSIGGRAIKKGTWMMTVRVLADDAWDLIKSGDLQGFSMAGYCLVEELK